VKGKILITGASGFLARNIYNKITPCVGLENIILISRQNLKCESECISLNDPCSVSEKDYEFICRENSITTIIHCGAIPKETILSWGVYERVNILWPLKLARAIKKVKGSNFIFISSLGVYGTAPRFLPAEETHPYMPDGKYHKSKAICEQRLLGELLDGTDVSLYILRLNALYGEGDCGVLMKMLWLYSKYILPTRASLYTSFCSVDLVSELIISILLEKVSGPFICNVSEPPIKVKELFGQFGNDIVGRLLNVPIMKGKSRYFRFVPWLYNKLALLFEDRIYAIERLSDIIGREVKPLEKFWLYMKYYKEIINK